MRKIQTKTLYLAVIGVAILILSFGTFIPKAEAVGLPYLDFRGSNTVILDDTGEVSSGCPSGYTAEVYDEAALEGDGYYGVGSTGTKYVCFPPSNDSGGSGSSGVTVSVNLTASPSTIDQGSSSTLTWSSVGATFCWSFGITTGGATSGTFVDYPADTTTYTVSCSGSGSSASDSATVTVIPIITPLGEDGGGSGDTNGGQSGEGGEDGNQGTGTDGEGSGDGIGGNGDSLLTLEAKPSLVTRGSQTSLNWSAEGVSGCVITATDFNSGELSDTEGQVQTNIINNTTTYTLACVDSGGSPVSVSETVKLVPRFQEQ